MEVVVVSDFDGTIVDIETAAFVLERFAEGEWKMFDEQLERGEITLEECMRKQFLLVRVSKKEILTELDRVTTFRPNFEKLIGFCKTQSVPLIVVSAGLDSCARHFLGVKGWLRTIELLAARARCTSDGIKFTFFPKVRYPESHNFKDDLVRYYRRRGQRVVYTGDGLTDYHAVKNADLAFVVRESELAQKCKREKIPHEEIADFQEVIDRIQRGITI